MVKYGGRSPKFILGSMSRDVHMQLYSLAETLATPPSPRIWTCITRALLVSKDRRYLYFFGVWSPLLYVCVYEVESNRSNDTCFFPMSLCQRTLIISKTKLKIAHHRKRKWLPRRPWNRGRDKRRRERGLSRICWTGSSWISGKKKFLYSRSIFVGLVLRRKFSPRTLFSSSSVLI